MPLRPLIAILLVLAAPAPAGEGPEHELLALERRLARARTAPAAEFFEARIRAFLAEHPGASAAVPTQEREQLLAQSRTDSAARYFAAALRARVDRPPLAGKTPEATFEALVDLIVEQRWRDALGLILPSKRKEATSDWIRERERGAESLSEFLGVNPAALRDMPVEEACGLYLSRCVSDTPRPPAALQDPRTIEAELDGETCGLTVRFADVECRLRLRREEGRWYFSDMASLGGWLARMRTPRAPAPPEPARTTVLVYRVREGTASEEVREAVRRRLRSIPEAVRVRILGRSGLEVRIEAPAGSGIPARVKSLLARRGTLEFFVLAPEETTTAERKRRAEMGAAYPGPPPGLRWVPTRVADGPDLLVELGGEDERFTGADLDPDALGIHPARVPGPGPGWVVCFAMREDRKQAFHRFTERILQRKLAVVVDGVLETAPTVGSPLPGQAQISGGGVGGFTKEEAQDLVLTLRSVPLPVGLVLVAEKSPGG